MLNPHRTNPLLHYLGGLVLVPALLGLIVWWAVGALGGERAEQTQFLILTLVVAVPIGGVLGFVSFVLTRGVRGWGVYFAQRRAAAAAGVTPTTPYAPMAPAAPVGDGGSLLTANTAAGPPLTPDDATRCCQDNVDGNGQRIHDGGIFCEYSRDREADDEMDQRRWDDYR